MRSVLAVLLALTTTAILPNRAHADTVLRLGTVAPEGTRYMKEAHQFAADVERLSGGDLSIKWYAGGKLGDEKTMAGLVVAGDQLDGGAFTAIGLVDLAPEMSFWRCPGLFDELDQVDFAEASFRDQFRGYFEQRGLVLLSWLDVGFEYVHSKTPVTSLADLRGRTVWMWQDDEALIRGARRLGMTVVSSSLADLSAGLADGKIDTWVFPPMATIAWGLHGYAHDVSDFRFSFMTGGVVVRKDVLDGLPADQRKVLEAAMKKWEPRLVKEFRAENEKALAAMAKQGVKITTIDAAKRREIYDAMAEQRAAFAKDLAIVDLMARFAPELDAYKKKEAR